MKKGIFLRNQTWLLKDWNSSDNDNHSIEQHNKNYAACSYKTFLPCGRILSCRSQSCRNELCRIKHAEKQSLIFEFSCIKRPPNYVINLRISDEYPIYDFQMSQYLGQFNDKIKYLEKTNKIQFKYDLRIEFTKGRPHVHGSLICNSEITAWKGKKLIKEMWNKSCDGRPTRVYFKPVRTVVGNAKYQTKNIKSRDKKVELIPETWDTKVCNISRCSRGFYIYPKEIIWKIWCDFFDICRTGFNTGQRRWFYNESIEWLVCRDGIGAWDWLDDFPRPLSFAKMPSRLITLLGVIHRIYNLNIGTPVQTCKKLNRKRKNWHMPRGP
jgi:hypothetical protein